MKKITAIIIPLVLAVSFAAKAKDKSPSSDANGTFAGQKIVVSGTGDSQELLRRIAGVLESKFSGCVIEIPNGVGTGAGIKAVAEGKIDLARVAREPRGKEKELGLTYLLFAKSPVIFAVNPSVKGIDNITSEQIVGIYSGQITDWNDIGAKTGKIYPLIRQLDDECEKVISGGVPGFADISTPAAKTIFTTQQMVEAVAEHPGTIGIMVRPAIIGTELRPLKIDGVEPSVENVLNGKYKYIVYFGIVYKEKPKGLAKEFVDFLYSKEGQKIITDSGVLPVKENIADK